MTYQSTDEADRLIALAESAGGIENLDDEGLRWRAQNTLDARRYREAKAARHGALTDAETAQRFAALEASIAWLRNLVEQDVGTVIGETVGEERQRAAAETKTLLAGLRDEINAKIDAGYRGFEIAVDEIRSADRRESHEILRSTISDAQASIDAGVRTALEAQWERTELEIALNRDEVMALFAEQKFGALDDTDDAPQKLVLCEKAIAGLRKRMAELETASGRHGAVIDQLGQVREALAAFEIEHKKAVKNVVIRCAANALAAKKESSRGDALETKIGMIEQTLARLLDSLLSRKIIE
jgi:hypothetical protein